MLKSIEVFVFMYLLAVDLTFAFPVNIETFGLDREAKEELYPLNLKARLLLNNKHVELNLQRAAKHSSPSLDFDLSEDVKPYRLNGPNEGTILVTAQRKSNQVERTLRGDFVYDDTMFSLSGSSGSKNHDLRIVENKRDGKSRYKRQQPMVEYHLSLEIFVNTDYFNRATSETELKIYFVNQFLGMDQAFKSLSRTGELRINLWLNNLYIQKTNTDHPIFSISQELGSTLLSDKNCNSEGADQATCCPYNIRQCFLQETLLNSLEVYLYRKNLDRQEDNKIDAVQFWTGIEAVSPGSDGRSIRGRSTGDLCRSTQHGGLAAVFGASYLTRSYFDEKSFIAGAHGLAHSLGAWFHDGTASASNCSSDTSIMFASLPQGETNAEKKEKRRFSSCTIKQILQRAQTYDCISNYTKCENDPVVNEFLAEASTETSLDKQCEQLFGLGSTYCAEYENDVHGACSWVRCMNVTEGICQTQTGIGHRDYSPCSADKTHVCQYDICREKSDVFFPKAPNPSECQGLLQPAAGGDAEFLEMYPPTTQAPPTTTVQYEYKTIQTIEYRFFPNKNCGGFPLNMLIYGLENCKTACNQNPQCSGFNFHNQGQNQYCYLRRDCDPHNTSQNSAYKKVINVERIRVPV